MKAICRMGLVYYIGLIVLGCTVARGDSSETVVRSVPARAGDRVEIGNVLGSVTVTGWDGATVEVEAEKSTNGSKEDLGRARIVVETVDGSITIRTEYNKKDGNGGSYIGRMFGWMISNGGHGVKVTYRIRVPRTADLAKVKTVNGDVRLDGTTGVVEAESVNGGIQVTGHSGMVDAHTVNGSIEIAGGSVRSARTTNGGIEVVFDRIPEGGATFKTVNGSVDLHLPRTAMADLSFRTVNGPIDGGGLPIMLKTIDKRRLEGSIGGNGPLINVETVNGGIRLHQGERPADAR